MSSSKDVSNYSEYWWREMERSLAARAEGAPVGDPADSGEAGTGLGVKEEVAKR